MRHWCGGKHGEALITVWVQCLIVALLPLGFLWRALAREQAARAELQLSNDVLTDQLARASARVKSLEAVAKKDRHGGDTLFAPRGWHGPRRPTDTAPIRFTVEGGLRCSLPFVFEGETRHDCVVIAGAPTPESVWCPLDPRPPGGGGGGGQGRASWNSQLLLAHGFQCQASFNQHALVNNFIHHIYARIGRSDVGGIGVIALRDIPAGTEPFVLPDGQACGIGEYINLNPKLVADAPAGVKSMMNDFFAIEPDGHQLVPVQGLNGLTLSYYLNHADGSKPNAPKPNMVPMQCHCPVMCFYATRDIRAGEELLFDYVSAFGEKALDQGVFEKIFSRPGGNPNG